MRALAAVAVIALLAALPAAGAGSGVGWTSHRLAAAGFALDTPGSWIEESTSAKPGPFARVARAFPGLAPSLQIARDSDLLKLLCVAPRGYPSVSVAVSVSPGLSLQELVAANVLAARMLPFVEGRPSVRAIRLPAGRAELVRYELGLQAQRVLELQYVLLRDGRAYVLSYSTRPASDAGTLATIGRSARSFRFLG